MKFKYKSIQNIYRLQEKIENLESDIDNYYKLNYKSYNKNLYFFELFFYYCSFLGIFFETWGLLLSLILSPFYLHYIKTKKYSLFNKIKLKIKSRDRRINENYSFLDWYFFHKYSFLDEHIERKINEFQKTLNSFEKRNLKHFFKLEKNKQCLNTINKAFYNVTKEYILNSSGQVLIKNKNEIFSFIDKIEIESLQDELINTLNNEIKLYNIEEIDNNKKSIKLKFQESKLDEDLIKIKKSKNKIIKNI